MPRALAAGDGVTSFTALVDTVEVKFLQLGYLAWLFELLVVEEGTGRVPALFGQEI